MLISNKSASSRYQASAHPSLSRVFPPFSLTEKAVHSLFVWLWLVVNDRKFSAGTVFFSHTNQPAVLLHEPATIRTSQTNRYSRINKMRSTLIMETVDCRSVVVILHLKPLLSEEASNILYAHTSHSNFLQ